MMSDECVKKEIKSPSEKLLTKMERSIESINTLENLICEKFKNYIPANLVNGTISVEGVREDDSIYAESFIFRSLDCRLNDINNTICRIDKLIRGMES